VGNKPDKKSIARNIKFNDSTRTKRDVKMKQKLDRKTRPPNTNNGGAVSEEKKRGK